MREEESAFENSCTDVQTRDNIRGDLCIDNAHKYFEEHSKVYKALSFWMAKNE